jgi:hypothetical protein
LLTSSTPLLRPDENDVFEVAEQGADDDDTKAGPLCDCSTQASRERAAAPPANTADHGPVPG